MGTVNSIYDRFYDKVPVLGSDDLHSTKQQRRDSEGSSFGSDGSISDLDLSNDSSEEETPIKVVLENMKLRKFNRFECAEIHSSCSSFEDTCSDSAHSSDDVADEEHPVPVKPKARNSKPWRIVQELRDREQRSISDESDLSDDVGYGDESDNDNESDSDDYLPEMPEAKKPRSEKTPERKISMERDFKDAGVKMRFLNKADAVAMADCVVEKWNVEKRNEQMEDMLKEGESFASDIFEVQGQNGDITEKVTVTINLAKSVSKRHKVKVRRKQDGVWLDEEANVKRQMFQSPKVEFNAKQLKHFVIVSELEVKKVKLSPEGAKITIDETSKLEVDIPAGAVDADVDVDFKIVPPDTNALKKYLEGDKPICKTITWVTECLYGNNPAVQLKKPIGVNLPFEDKHANEDDVTVVPFQMVGKDIRIMDAKTNVNDEGVCNIEMGELTGVFAAKVKTKYLADRRQLENDVKLLFGTTYVANILTFREKDKMPTGFPRLWIQVVDKADVEKVVGRRQEENGLIEVHNSRSPDINVFDGFRLRIDITGNLQGLREIPKSHYFITYLDVSDDNHKIFTVEKKGTMETFGQISYLCDKHAKRHIHSIDVDTTVGFEKTYRKDQHRHTTTEGEKQTLGSDANSGEDEANCLCPALSNTSLSTMVAMVTSPEDSLKLATELALTQEYNDIIVKGQTESEATIQMLKIWREKQTSKDEAVSLMNKFLLAAKLYSIANAFLQGVMKNKRVEKA